MTENLIWEFFRQTCEALADLHAKNILHRDVKYNPVGLCIEPYVGLKWKGSFL